MDPNKVSRLFEELESKLAALRLEVLDEEEDYDEDDDEEDEDEEEEDEE